MLFIHASTKTFKQSLKVKTWEKQTRKILIKDILCSYTATQNMRF